MGKEEFKIDPELKKEEVERLETERKTEDLGTYIKLHKEIILPPSEVLNSELKEEILRNKGHFILAPSISKNYPNEQHIRVNELYYIDKEKNIAKIGIILEDIENLKKQLESCPKNKIPDNRRKIIIGELDKLGFVSDTSLEDEKRTSVQIINEMWEKIFKAANEYKIKLEKEVTEKVPKKEKEEEKEEFDF